MTCNKKVSIALFLMLAVFLNCGSARPAISTKSLGNKLTPSITLVFQSLHNAATVKASEQTTFERQDGLPATITRQQQLELVPKDSLSLVPIEFQPVNKDGLLRNPGGVFGDAESGKLSSIVVPPVAAF